MCSHEEEGPGSERGSLGCLESSLRVPVTAGDRLFPKGSGDITTQGSLSLGVSGGVGGPGVWPGREHWLRIEMRRPIGVP